MHTNGARREILDFLRDLRDHNDRDWFESRRPRYESARAAFLELVGELISGFDAVDDIGNADVRDCVFRINRDVRFGADKRPYKSTMSALLGPRGRKSGVRSYYFHLEPDGRSMLAGGLHSPTSAQLRAFRDAIARDAGPFRRVIEAPGFRECFGDVSGERLKTAPQGYAKDHPAIGLLRLKTVLAHHPLDDESVCSPDLIPRALGVFRAMKPFLGYLERVTGD